MRLLTSLLFAGFVGQAFANPFYQYQNAAKVSQQQAEAMEILRAELPKLQQHVSDHLTKLSRFNMLEVHSASSKMSTLADPSVAPAAASTAPATIAPTQDCVATVTALSAKLTTCGLASSAWTGNDFSTGFSALCAKTDCVKELQTAVIGVQASCGGLDATISASLQSFAQLNAFLRVGCDKDPASGKYCIAQFADSESAFQKIAQSFDASVLDAICGPCTQSLMNALTIFAPPAESKDANSKIAAALSLYCIKDPTDSAGKAYCMTRFAKAYMGPSTAPPSSKSSVVPPEIAENMCHPCTKKIFAGYSAVSAAIGGGSLPAGVAGMVDSLCVSNKQGVRCLNAFNNMASMSESAGNALQETCKDLILSKTCNSACKGAVAAFLAPMGCCLGSISAALASMGGDASAATMFAMLTPCNVDTTPCPAVASTAVTAKLGLPTLPFAWCTANMDKCKAALTADVAAAALVDKSQVTITFSAAASGSGTSVSISIKATSDYDNLAAQTSLNTKISSQTLVLPSTTQAVLSDKTAASAAASKGVVPDTATSTSASGAAGAPTKTNDASHLTLGVSALFAFALALFAQRQ